MDQFSSDNHPPSSLYLFRSYLYSHPETVFLTFFFIPKINIETERPDTRVLYQNRQNYV